MIKQKSSVLSYEGVPSQQVNELYILYGSRSGNAKGAAILAYEYATYLGISSKCISMDEFPFENLPDVRNLIICVSTHGEGDPPVPAESFYQHLHQHGLPAFNDIHYAVLALGDSSYKHYCQTGTDMDSRLESLGGKRIHPLATCDLDFEENAKDWIKKTVEAFKTHLRIESSAKKNSFVFKIASNDVESNAFSAKIIEKRRLSEESSTKNVMHVALDITGSGIDYKAGDSIGIYSYNSRLLVDKFLKVLKLEGTSFIEFKGKIKLLKEALIQNFELTVLTPLVITKYASLI
ncbi:MAG: flavodoxin domain-containing protein, partial [Bacteroidetes bacterium]|nr:flavodoxin domain-containing protein [Bacteroidota bacterium]